MAALPTFPINKSLFQILHLRFLIAFKYKHKCTLNQAKTDLMYEGGFLSVEPPLFLYELKLLDA